ncbi:MAG: hypothetical protein H0W66_01530 [Chthoniobacterales bacterium]|nr:hypothetical protein [Chthoniobacterales bacterium]
MVAAIWLVLVIDLNRGFREWDFRLRQPVILRWQAERLPYKFQLSVCRTLLPF